MSKNHPEAILGPKAVKMKGGGSKLFFPRPSPGHSDAILRPLLFTGPLFAQVYSMRFLYKISKNEQQSLCSKKAPECRCLRDFSFFYSGL